MAAPLYLIGQTPVNRGVFRLGRTFCRGSGGEPERLSRDRRDVTADRERRGRRRRRRCGADGGRGGGRGRRAGGAWRRVRVRGPERAGVPPGAGPPAPPAAPGGRRGRGGCAGEGER